MLNRVKKVSCLIVGVLLVSAFVSGCSHVPRVPIPEYTPPEARFLPSGGEFRSIAFNKMIVDIDRGAIIGAYHSGMSRNETAYCNLDLRTKMKWNHAGDQVGLREYDPMARAFYSTLEKKGYNVVWDSAVVFNRKRDCALADLIVSARVHQITANVCRHYSMLDMRPLHVAEAETDLLVEWFVYDVKKKKDVFRLKSRGYAPVGIGTRNGFDESMADAFAAAALELANNLEFMKLVEKTGGE